VAIDDLQGGWEKSSRGAARHDVGKLIGRSAARGALIRTSYRSPSASVRHVDTAYDRLLMSGVDRETAPDGGTRTRRGSAQRLARDHWIAFVNRGPLG
jgi:hypothetical protein